MERPGTRPPETLGIALGLVAMTLWSFGDGLWKYALIHTSMPVVFCLTYGTSCLATALYAKLKHQPLRPKQPRNAAIFAVLYALELLSFVYALSHVPLVPLFVIILSAPLFVLVCAHFALHETLSRQQILSVCAGFAGAAVVTLARETAGESHVIAQNLTVPPAIVFALANVVLNGTKIIFMRRHCQDENVFGLGFCFTMLVSIISAVLAWPALPTLPIPVAAALISTGLMSTIGQLAYIRAFQIARAPLVSATQYSQIVWAMLIGGIVFNETMSGAAMTGVALIILSGVLLYGRYLPWFAARPSK